ncbi:MAG: acyl carrier protein [Chloroflexi bacterium]|nr:acyl carrier protein [Chloroflexota bacterium]
MGDENEMFEQIKKVICDVLRIDGAGITMETRFIEDLKADSMDQFFLIDGFSEQYNVAISDDDARLIKTVGDAVRYFSSHK